MNRDDLSNREFWLIVIVIFLIFTFMAIGVIKGQNIAFISEHPIQVVDETDLDRHVWFGTVDTDGVFKVDMDGTLTIATPTNRYYIQLRRVGLYTRNIKDYVCLDRGDHLEWWHHGKSFKHLPGDTVKL